MRVKRSIFSYQKIVLLIFAVTIILGCAPASNKIKSVKAIRGEAASAPVLLMPIDIEVGSLLASGQLRINQEWTSRARDIIESSIISKLDSMGIKHVNYSDEKYKNHPLFQMHQVVSISATHTQQHMALPSRKDYDPWTLGQSGDDLKRETGAKYAFFIYFKDAIPTGSRVALGVLGGLTVGTTITNHMQSLPNSPQIAPTMLPGKMGAMYLVDLESGNIAWYQMIFSGARDMRIPDDIVDATHLWFKDFPVFSYE